MNRVTSIVVAIAVAALAILIVAKGTPSSSLSYGGAGHSSLVGDAGTGASSGTLAAATDLNAALAAVTDAGVALVLPNEEPVKVEADSGAIELPATGTPRSVRFGVVLVTYDGAQGGNGSVKGRSKADAHTIAERLANEARGDFHGAVEHGDVGSADDVGHVQRGVLEAASEAVLFALPVGAVSDAIDTPRGFWIVKRLE